MPFPSGTPIITLTGTLPSAVGGTAFSGRVILTPSATLIDATRNAIYPGGGSVLLDAAGSFSVQVIPDDADGIQPAGWKWRVDEQPAGGNRRTYWIDLPTSAGPTIDLSRLAPVPAPGGGAGSGNSGGPTSPTGPAGGALTGTYPDPTLAPATAAAFDAAGSASTAQTAAITTAATDATTKVTNHTTATDPHGDRAYADGKLTKTANLSDLTNTTTARSNLGLGSAAVLSVGTTAGTVAAGDDSRITGSLPLAGGTMTGTITSSQTAASNTVLAGIVAGENFDRVRVMASGLIEVGSGSATRDTNWRRSAANEWTTDDAVIVSLMLRHLGTTLGFYGATAATKPTVTGSRGGNAALASLLTALATLGLITDSTSA